MQHFRPTLALKPLIPLLSTSPLLPLYPLHRLMLLTVLLHRLIPFPPDSLRVLQWNAGGLRARSIGLLHFLLSHPVDLISFSNLILTHFPLSGSKDSLLYDQIAPTSGLAFYLPIPRILAAASSFSLGRAYSSLNFLLPLFFRLTPTLII